MNAASTHRFGGTAAVVVRVDGAAGGLWCALHHCMRRVVLVGASAAAIGDTPSCMPLVSHQAVCVYKGAASKHMLL